MQPKMVSGEVSIEAAIEAIRTRSETTNPNLQAKLLALRAYIADVVEDSEREWAGGHKDATNQLRLFRFLEEWRERTDERIRVVTFNYDRLAERAVQRSTVGVGFGAMSTFIKAETHRVYKLHGSVDWWRALNAGEAGLYEPLPKTMANYSAEVAPSTMKGGPEWIRAVSIPLATKTDSQFECPQEHLDDLIRELPSVDRVISIGWRGNEEHFMALWRDHAPKELRTVITVSPSEKTANKVATILAENIPSKGTLPCAEGFSKFLAGNTLQIAFQ